MSTIETIEDVEIPPMQSSTSLFLRKLNDDIYVVELNSRTLFTCSTLRRAYRYLDKLEDAIKSDPRGLPHRAKKKDD